MAQIVTVLIESFAAWETSLLSAMARGSYGVDIADTAVTLAWPKLSFSYVRPGVMRMAGTDSRSASTRPANAEESNRINSGTCCW